MMKKLACRATGMDCDFVAYGKTVDEVMNKGMEHAKVVHPEKYEKMMKMSPTDMAEMKMSIMAKIEDVAEEGM